MGAGTSINDAVLDITDYWRRQPAFAGRRALIILTDNGGVHYQLPDETVIRALSEVDAVLNAMVPPNIKPPERIKPGPNVNPDFSPANVFHLAQESGGEIVRVDKTAPRFQEIIDHVRQRYSILIAANKSLAGTYHRLNVDLSPEARKRYPKADVRARAGYYSLGE